MASDDHLRAVVERAIGLLEECEDIVKDGENDLPASDLRGVRVGLEDALEDHGAAAARADALVEYLRAEATGVLEADRCGPVVFTHDAHGGIVYSDQAFRVGYRPLAHFPASKTTIFVPLEWTMGGDDE